MTPVTSTSGSLTSDISSTVTAIQTSSTTLTATASPKPTYPVDPNADCTNVDVSASIDIAGDKEFKLFHDVCASTVSAGMVLTVIRSEVYYFSEWSRQDAINACAQFTADVGGQSFEFRRWKGLKNWECDV